MRLRHPPIVVNVVTPCSRVENLPELRRSLDIAQANTSHTILRWWVIADGQRVTALPRVSCYHSEIVSADGLSGNPQRNRALDLISCGWVYFLDDDNLIHEQMLKALESVVAANPQMEGFMVAQEVGGGVRLPDTPVKCQIDTAQFALTRRLIGETRFDPFDYCADGGFIEAIHARNAGSFIATDQVLAYYNRLAQASEEPRATV